MGLFGSNMPDVEQMERDRDIGGLIGLFNHSNNNVKVKAIVALVNIGDPAVFHLIDALKYGSTDTSCVVQTLGRIGMPAVRQLAEILKDTSGGYMDVQMNAAFALGMIDDPGAVDALIEALENDIVRDYAIVGLKMMEQQEYADPRIADILKRY